VFLIITPMMLLCGTFFPLSSLPQPIHSVAMFLPLTHVVIATRELALGSVTAASGLSLLALATAAVILFIIAVNLMRKRLIK